MVNLVRVKPEQVVEEIVEPLYFNLYDLYTVMFGVEDAAISTGVYYELHRPVLPLLKNGHLQYPALPHRQAFCRLLWDRHCYFSVVPDFSYRNWILYNLADIDWSISDQQVTQVWRHIDEVVPNARLLGMRDRSFYY
jgi:hypothetical protein